MLRLFSWASACQCFPVVLIRRCVDLNLSLATIGIPAVKVIASVLSLERGGSTNRDGEPMEFAVLVTMVIQSTVLQDEGGK